MSQETTQEFGKLRSFFWPVHGYELKKMLPMFIMFFFISFNYTILRDTKDSMIVPASGAETIPFLKLWGTIPAAVIFMVIYSKLSNILTKEKLFYVTIIPFILFFALFATVLYPNKDLLHPTASADFLQSILPGGWGKGLAGCYRNWTYSLFYIFAELWGSAILSLMFWGFANEIMRISEAKRVYTTLGIGANIALLFSGPTIIYFSDIRKTLPPNIDAWQVSLNYLMGLVVLAGLAIIGIYWWMNRNVLTDPRFYDPKDVKKKSKSKLSLKDSFLCLVQSKYIGCISLLVICYGICINLVEVTWKSQVGLQYPDPNDYSTFMGYLSTVTGPVTIVMMLIGGYVLRKKGWGFAAIITPTVLLITGIGFFAFVIFRGNLQGVIAMVGSTPLMLAVIFGMAQNVMSKSTKYSLFDPTKEMTYIPLDQEQKVKGKTAIDVVGARLGKAGGSIIYQILFAFGTLASLTPYIAIIMVGVIFVWITAVKSLNKQFLALTSDTPKPEEDKEPEGTPAVQAAT
ncbi:MAG: ADP,ATP carrier protein 1 [Chlamydiae bacterium]|nr:ADP,ATP carrier protein 1 [Chlamydiota bacterium]